MPRRLLLLCSFGASLALLLVSPPWSRASADQYSRRIAALQAQAFSLETQLTSLNQQGSYAVSQAAALQQQLDATTTALATAQIQLNSANERLATVTTELATTETTLEQDRAELASLVDGMYRMQGQGTVIAALIDSKSFVDAVDVMTTLGQVSGQMRTLVSSVHQKEQQLVSLRAARLADFNTATQLVSSLKTLSAQQQGERSAYQSLASALNSQATSLLAQLQTVQTQLDNLLILDAEQQSGGSGGSTTVQGTALPPFAFGPRVDYFPWGQCTWYVASLRTVTWDGDAGAWAANAAAQGMQEGLTPKVGAIVVFGPGNGYSDIGHVAYVVSVQSPTAFTLDEANYVGLGIVDQRAVTSLNDVEAFIY